MVAVSDVFAFSLVALFVAQINHADAVPTRPVVSASNLKHRLLHFLHLDRSEGGAHHVITERFSFARWVDDKFANPDDTALSPEQAWQAYLDSAAADKDNDDASPPATGPENKRWDSQVTCRDKNRGKAADAVSCIQVLHATVNWTNVQYPCHTYPVKLTGNKGEEVTIQAWCHANDMIIAPYITAGTDLGQDETKLPTCESVAQTVGVILDTCTRESDHTVSGWREKDLTGLNKVGVSVITAQTFMIEG